ncbi:MAG: hypothetical protein ABJB86_17015, partial [Bacteroidota bacterium]
LATWLLFSFFSKTAFAAGKPLPVLKWKQTTIAIAVSDSNPPAKSQQENNPAKTTEIIKEVPKAHKQEKPIAVTTTIKPVLVKPKIIVKPIIKLH